MDDAGKTERDVTPPSAESLPVKKNKPPRPKPTLTTEQARQAFALWRLSGPCGAVTDEQVADVLGVTFAQLRGWLRRNTVPIDPKTGQPPLDPETRRPTTKGLRAIRTRARAEHRPYYLGVVHKSIVIAEQNDDPNAMRLGAIWMLEKLNLDMFPQEKSGEGDSGTGVLVVEPPLDEEEWLRIAEKDKRSKSQ